MKKKTFICFLLIVLVSGFSSVVGQTTIFKAFSYYDADEGSLSVEQLPSGGYIGVGTASFTFNPATRHNDIWIWRFNELGDTLWTKKFYQSGNGIVGMWATGAASASDGGLFILINRKYIGTADYHYNSVMRTNAQGDSIWSVDISVKDWWAKAELLDIKATPDGGCIIAGMTNFTNHPRILKISTTGTISWESVIEIGGTRRFNSVCLTSDGGYIATGGGMHTFDGNLVVAKFTNAGALVWSKTFYSGSFTAGDKRKAFGQSVAPTSDGGCMISGWVTEPETYTRLALLMRLNTSGDSLWTKNIGRNTGQSASSVVLTWL